MSENFFSGLLAALVSAAIVVVQPQIAIPQTVDEQAIASLAKDVTVVINGQNPGSGVIVSRDGNTYYVLTAKHVVATQDEYEIVTSDGTKYPLNYSSVKKLPGVDLALVAFTSNKNYPLALLGDSEATTEGATVYISGWPHPGRAITQRIYQITKGSISGRPLESLENGYGLVYTNITRSGMSGSPIWDTQGRVIGIHGQAEGEQIINPDGNTIAVKSGFNLGIPINTFLKLSSHNGIDLSYLQDNFSLIDTIVFKEPCSKADVHRYYGYYLNVSPDYQMIAIVRITDIDRNSQREISLCSTKTGKELRTLEGHSYRTESLVFSPDGQILISKGIDDRDRSSTSIKIWNVNTGQLLRTLTSYEYTGRVFISSNSNILASIHDYKIVRIWNLNTGKLLHEVDHEEQVTTVAISPDSQIFVSGSSFGTLKIWNLSTGELLRTLSGQGVINVIEFSPDNPILISGSWSSRDSIGSPESTVDDATLQMWNWQTGELLGTLIENYGTIDSLALEPYGQLLASTSKNEIKIWNLQTGQLLRTLEANGIFLSVAFSGDGQTLFSTDLYDLQIWQVAIP
ncbi:MAG: trypsin-like peptidase domain-containing protein [Coleofasciculus sp. B1-GNL1-01]|uniref:trypsin-like peptidase domain-containing protein n=1 Tax=Coleofasciculus sp. B1-GNL1-01 TaxID=3068484 RepID=UPI0032F29B50